MANRKTAKKKQLQDQKRKEEAKNSYLRARLGGNYGNTK